MELRTEVQIDAAAERIWAVLTDFRAYPDWNPFIARIRGKLDPGARLEVHLTPPGGRELTFRPKVLKVEPERELRWRGHLLVRGLLDGEHFFKLEPLDERRTRFIHGEDFSGMLVKMMQGGGFRRIANGFVGMNEALRKRVQEVGGS